MMRLVISGVARRLTGYFLTGVFTILPLAITAAVAIWLAEFIKSYLGRETMIGKALAALGGQLVSTGTLAYWIGWIVVLAAIFLLGVLVEAGARKLLHSMIDAVLTRIPLAGSVYTTAKQLVGMMEAKDDDKLKGMRVVYCVFGKESATGVLALMPSPQLFTINARQYHVVYIPTSPIPMTGGLLFVPAESVHDVNMSVDGLMSIYLSMGITGPQFLKEGAK